MKDIKKIKELQELLNSGVITESEYGNLMDEIDLQQKFSQQTESVYNPENSKKTLRINNSYENNGFNANHILRIQMAGKAINNILFTINIQLGLAFFYGIGVGFSTTYYKELDAIISFRQIWYYIFIIIEIIVFIYMVMYIKQAANHLMKVDKPFESNQRKNSWG